MNMRGVEGDEGDAGDEGDECSGFCSGMRPAKLSSSVEAFPFCNSPRRILNQRVVDRVMISGGQIGRLQV